MILSFGDKETEELWIAENPGGTGTSLELRFARCYNCTLQRSWV